MNFLNLLTKEKRVAGIEISDSVIRIAFLRPIKNKKRQPIEHEALAGENFITANEELILIEEPITANIIENGVVLDVSMLGKTLKNIWSKANLGTNYAIVSIPDDKIYSKVFSFPRSVNDARLTEAMRLAVGFQLPTRTEDAYLDWETINGTDTVNEILLSTVPKKIVQEYVTALEFAGIQTIALESHLASIARAAELAPGEITLFTKETPDGATIFAIENGGLRFSRTLPRRFVPKEKIPDEVSKLKSSLEAGAKGVVPKVNVVSILDAEISKEYRALPGIVEPQAKWIISLGAAIRGKIPEGDDGIISLLPVGTEEAYAYQKVTSITLLIRNLTIGISAFFVIAFLSAFFFISFLSQSRIASMVSLSAGVASPDLIKNEERINNTNALTALSSSLLAKTPLWSMVIDEVMSRITNGITISNFSAPSFDGQLSLTGIAAGRVELNLFKKSLQESSMFEMVEIPTTNLGQKDAIPFSASFHIKDPSALYYK